MIVNAPIPSNFQIFSSSTETINWQPSQDFYGTIYAPNATVNMQPNGDFYGMIWADLVDIQPNGVIYVDMDAIDSLDSERDIEKVSWRRVLDE